MRSSLTLLSLLLVASAANASPIRFDFVIDGSTIVGTGIPAGDLNGSGFVVFDTDLATLADPAGHLGDRHTPLPTIDLSFDWLGQHYDSSSATLGAATFVDGLPTAWQLDALTNSPFCSPASGPIWDRFDCVQFGTNDFTLSAFAGGTGVALLSWESATTTPYARAQVTWSLGDVGVPEPGTSELMAVALIGLLLFSRRRAEIPLGDKGKV